jgi:hypothetical protein
MIFRLSQRRSSVAAAMLAFQIFLRGQITSFL